MPRVRVPVAGTVGKSVLIETDTPALIEAATGATIGVDFMLPDGSIPSFIELAAALQTEQESAQQWPFTFWNRILEVPAVLASLAALTDPNENSVLYWDDTAEALDFADNLHIDEAANLVDVRLGNTLRVRDAANTNYGDMSHDSISFSIVGGINAGNILDLTGSSAAPDTGIIRANSPVTFTYDTVSNTTPVQPFLMQWGPTIAATSGYVGGCLQTEAVFNITTGTFIPAIFSDTNRYNVGAVPGFSAITFINELSLVANDGNFNLPSALVMNIGLTHERNTSGTSTTAGTTGISFSPQTRATVSGAVMTKTSQTAVRCSPTHSTVSGSTVNYGTIRGLHMFNPAVALFQGQAGVEAMTAYVGVDMENIAFGGNVVKAAVRSNHTSTGANSYFLLNNGNAVSDFAGSNIHFNDIFGISFGNTPTTADLNIGVIAGGALFFNWTTGDTGQLRMSSEVGGTGGPADRFLWTSTVRPEYTFDCDAFSLGVQTGSNGNQVGAFIAGTRATKIAGDYTTFLQTEAGNVTVDHAIGLLASWTVNAPSITLGTGSVTTAAVLNIGGNPGSATTNRVGVRIISNPSGGSGVNAALWCTAGLAQLDGGVNIIGLLDVTGLVSVSNTISINRPEGGAHLSLGATDGNLNGIIFRLRTNDTFVLRPNSLSGSEFGYDYFLDEWFSLVDFSVTGDMSATTIGGIVEADLLDRSADETLTGAYTFTNANAIIVSGTAPDIRIFETDATADEGNWLIRAQTDQFRIASATDAAPSTAVENAIIIARSGSGIGAIDFQTTLLRLNDSSFRIDGRGSAAASFLDIRIDNSAAQRSFIELFNDANVNVLDMRLNTGDSIQFFDPRTSEIWLQHVTGSDVRVRDGLSFRIYDSGDTDFADFNHDGADFNTDFTLTANWNIGSGLTGGIVLPTGIDLRIGGNIGFYDTAPVAQAAAYTVTNPVTRRTFDTTTVTLQQLAEVVGTLIADDQAMGLRA